MPRTKGMSESVVATGVIAVLLAWLIRQIIESVSREVREAGAEAMRTTQRAASTNVEATQSLFDKLASSLTAALTTTVQGPTPPPAGIAQPSPMDLDTWWNDPAFDPMGNGIDPTDSRIVDTSLGRPGVAFIEPGGDILAELTGMPHGDVPPWAQRGDLNLPGEMIPEDFELPNG